MQVHTVGEKPADEHYAPWAIDFAYAFFQMVRGLRCLFWDNVKRHVTSYDNLREDTFLKAACLRNGTTRYYGSGRGCIHWKRLAMNSKLTPPAVVNKSTMINNICGQMTNL